MLVIEVQPSVNLKSETIEQVVSKMQSSYTSLVATMKADLNNSGVPDVVLKPLTTILQKAKARGREYFNTSKLYLEATKEAIEAQMKCFERLTLKATWHHEPSISGTGPSSIVNIKYIQEHMHLAAQLCARNDCPKISATILQLRARLSSDSQDDFLKTEAKRAIDKAREQFSQVEMLKEEEMDAFKALTELLESGKVYQQPWPQTVLELCARAGDKEAVQHVAIVGLALGVPLAVLRHRIFEMDATVEACRGADLLHAASEGSTAEVIDALSHDHVKLFGLHEHPLLPIGEWVSRKCDPNLEARCRKQVENYKCDIGGNGCVEHSAYRCAHKDCDFDVCSECYEKKNDVDVCLQNQVTPLMLAARSGSRDVVKLLLERGAEPNRRSKHLCTALSLAVEYQSAEAKDVRGSEVVKLLLDRGAHVRQVMPDKEGQTPLYIAIEFGARTENGLQTVTHMLESLTNSHEGKPLATKLLNEETDKKGTTGLMRASQAGGVKMTKLLLNYQADINLVNADGRTALFFAVQAHNSAKRQEDIHEVVQTLCAARADPNIGQPMARGPDRWQFPIDLVIPESPDMVRLLLKHRAHLPTGRATRNLIETVNIALSVLQKVCHRPEQGSKDEVRLKKMYTMTEILLSDCGASANQLEESEIKRFEESQAEIASQFLKLLSPTARDGMASRPASMPRSVSLLQSVKDKDLEKVKEAIQNLQIHDADINERDDKGRSALWTACYTGQTEVVDVLIKNEANLNTPDVRKTTPLCAAVYNTHAGCLQLMIDAKADLNLFDEDGDTPLHNACFVGDLNCTRLLLKHDAHTHKRNLNGELPLDMATSTRGGGPHLEILDTFGAQLTQKVELFDVARPPLHEHPLMFQKEILQEHCCDVGGPRCCVWGTAYRCTEGCDFDVCKECFTDHEHSRGTESGSADQLLLGPLEEYSDEC